MSHFCMYVLLPKNIASVQEAVREALAPYDENLKVPEYDRRCWCVGRKAVDDAEKKADSVETIGSIRERFHADLKKDRDLLRSKTSAEREQAENIDRIQEAWQSDAYFGAWKKRADEALAAHPDRERPRQDCDECKGTGAYKSTRNPKSKWDWWRIGGRWDGQIIGDRRSSEGGFNFDDKHEMVQNNTRAVADFPSPLPESEAPFALLTPDGQWHERGEMGWFGCVSNEKPRSAWIERVRELLSENSDSIAVCIDCHI